MANILYVNKCKSLHIGKDTSNSDYQMEDIDGTNITVAHCEKKPWHLCPSES